MLTTRCILIAKYIIHQSHHNGFALYQPNYGRKIVLIARQTFVYHKTRVALLRLKWLYFRSGIVYQMFDSGSKTPRCYN